jgi:glutathione S-transferase
MSEFVAYGIPGSPFLRSALLVLEEKRQPYRLQTLAVGENRGESHLARNAFGRIPVLEHGDFRLYETQAILRYVDAVCPSPAMTPKDPRASARMNQIIGINDWYLFPQVGVGIVFQRIVGPVLLGKAPDENVIAAAVPKAQVCLGEIERLLGNQPFLAGDELSLADLMMAPPLAYAAMTPEGKQMLKGTKLAAWLGRMNSRPSMQATLPPERLRQAA